MAYEFGVGQRLFEPLARMAPEPAAVLAGDRSPRAVWRSASNERGRLPCLVHLVFFALQDHLRVVGSDRLVKAAE